VAQYPLWPGLALGVHIQGLYERAIGH